MICDEDFIISALDVPIQTVQVQHYPPTPAVSYSLDEKRKLWSKMINLDQCDRASLSSLFAYINFIRNLLPQNNSTWLSLPRQQIDLKQSSLVLSYPFTSFGSIYDVLQRLGHGLTEQSVATLFARAVLAINCLHSQRILHRALCSHHLLLVPDQQKQLNVSLCGLGSITRLRNHQQHDVKLQRNELPQIHFGWRGWNKSEKLNCHPIAWYSPEMIGQDFTGYSYPTDIYSLGLVLGEMITGRTPYFGIEPSVIALRKLCGEPEYPEFYQPGTNQLLSEGMLDTYVACVQRDPRKRPSSAALLELPWVRWGLESKFYSEDLEREMYTSLSPQADNGNA